MTYLTNSFSINMLKEGIKLRFGKVTLEAAQETLMHTGDTVKNCIGHADTDALVRAELEQEFGAGTPMLSEGRRESIEFHKGDTLVVAQYTGPRLPEGATQLPEGAKIEYWIVTAITEAFMTCPFCGCEYALFNGYCPSCGAS